MRKLHKKCSEKGVVKKMPAVIHHISGETIDEKVNRRRIDLLFSGARNSNIFVIVGSIVISFSIWSMVPVFPLVTWVSVMIVLACARFFVCCYLYRKKVQNGLTRKKNEFLYVVLTAILGLSWSSLALLPNVFDSTYSQSVLFLTMVATLFIAVILLAMHKVAQLFYMTPFPLVLVFSLVENHHPWAMQFSALAVMFLIYMLWLGKQSHDSLKKSLTLHFTNEALIEQLEVSIENEKIANRAKRDFLANMSHEIRTPMAGILGMTQLVLETELNEEQKKYLHNVKISADSLLGLLNDILDFSKIEAGQLVLEQNVFSLPAMLNNIGSMYHFTAVKKGVTLIMPADTSTLPAFVMGDELRLRQILTNLISNGLKFTLQGEVKVVVECLLKDKDTVELVFSVTDTGIGIPADKKELVFSSFSQADSSTARQFGGSGLGLAICKQLVEMMGGAIWFEDHKKQGTRFYFTVVCGVASRQEFKAPVDATIKNSIALRILLVDDNRVNQDLAALFLKRYEHQVVVAENGLEALEILSEQEDFDLIFMDVQMPIMDGLVASSVIRESEKGLDLSTYSLPSGLAGKLTRRRKTKHIPIVAMTANAMSGDRQKCLDAGMDAYLTKPFQRDQMLNILRKITGDFSLVSKNVSGMAHQGQRKQQVVHRQDVRKVVFEHLKNVYRLEDKEIVEFLHVSRTTFLQNIDKALQYDMQNDLVALSGAAHSLKGSFLNLGLNDLAARAREIELKSREGEKKSYKKQLEDMQNNLLVMLADCSK